MSQENITKFAEATAVDPALQKKIHAIHAQAASETAEKIAALSAEAGTPFTAEEFLAASQTQLNSLSDEDLEKVAGGEWRASSSNILTSIFTVGVGCVISAVTSAAGGNLDSCQPDMVKSDRLPN